MWLICFESLLCFECVNQSECAIKRSNLTSLTQYRQFINPSHLLTRQRCWKLSDLRADPIVDLLKWGRCGSLCCPSCDTTAQPTTPDLNPCCRRSEESGKTISHLSLRITCFLFHCSEFIVLAFLMNNCIYFAICLMLEQSNLLLGALYLILPS